MIKYDLKIASTRLKNQYQKNCNVNLVIRRQILQLLQAGKEHSARIQTEMLINNDLRNEAYEFLELNCNTVIARYAMIENSKYVDISVEKPLHNIIYASLKLSDIPELVTITSKLAKKYGPNLAVSAAQNTQYFVDPKLIRRLDPSPPSDKLVDAYLQEIAVAGNLDWKPAVAKPSPLSADLYEIPDEVMNMYVPPTHMPVSNYSSNYTNDGIKDEVSAIDDNDPEFIQYLMSLSAPTSIAMPSAPPTNTNPGGNDTNNDDFEDPFKTLNSRFKR